MVNCGLLFWRFFFSFSFFIILFSDMEQVHPRALNHDQSDTSSYTHGEAMQEFAIHTASRFGSRIFGYRESSVEKSKS